MIRFIKLIFGIGVIVNAAVLISQLSEPTNVANLTLFFSFFIAYIIADIVKDALGNIDDKKS
jgi:hypothetical protein